MPLVAIPVSAGSLGTVRAGNLNVNITTKQTAQGLGTAALAIAVTEGFCHGFLPTTPVIKN